MPTKVCSRCRSSKPLTAFGVCYTTSPRRRVPVSGRKRVKLPAAPIRLARLERERVTPHRTGVLTATFRFAAPARCGAFVDERRVVCVLLSALALRTR
jgi:hypothetical protein